MAPALTAVYAKVRSWAASITSPSSTHASGMLIILGILAAVTDAQSVKEPIRVHHPKVASRSNGAAAADKLGANQDGGADAKQINHQEMMYYLAMGMLVSQGLIRLVTFISNRREAAALAARKKDDDLLQDNDEDDTNDSAKKNRRKGLSLNALEDLDEEILKQKRREHLAALGDNASLLGSDSEDDDYEQSDEESSSEEELEDEEEEEDESEEDEIAGEDSESEGEIERRRRVLAAGDAEIEE
ncbi:hypothetical protein BGZ68_002856 [Mortierella alpina]|nr:hypothetical protein BGZ68_002856 [Mortierella alpina]